MQKKTEDFSLQDAMALAKSPAGQQLLAMLQQSDSDTMKKAMDAVNAGNISDAAEAISKILTPEIRKLAKDLGG